MDLHNNIEFRRALSPVVITDNTAQVCEIIDRSGFRSLEFAILTGTLADADATFTVLVEHGDAANLSDAAAVPDGSLLGLESEASFTFAADNVTKKIGYRGTKRYIRLTLTPAANTGNAPLCVIAVMGNPNLAPV